MNKDRQLFTKKTDKREKFSTLKGAKRIFHIDKLCQYEKLTSNCFSRSVQCLPL